MLCVGACSAPDIGTTGSHRPVVIQAILIGNQPLQTFTILWASTNDAPTPTDVPPPADIHLWLVSPAGDSTPVIHTGVSGVFTAALVPQPGTTYWLKGTIADSTIVAQTTIPTSVHLVAPRNGDTLIARNDLFLVERGATNVDVPVQLQAVGAFGYALFADFASGTRFVATNGGLLPVSVATFVSHGTIFTTGFGVQDTTVTAMTLRTWAVDANVASFARSNVSSTLLGASGLFGSLLSDSVRLVIVH